MKPQKCSVCGRPSDRPGQRQCRKCHAEYQRAYRVRRADELADLRGDLAGLRARVKFLEDHVSRLSAGASKSSVL
ncbi:MAG: hypothetical protein LBQ06_00180 [Frankiaceae bacterium]|nr:hypothetical protein [Frankiaceae bacterium]